MFVPEGLRKIASMLNAPLYIVGGFVRNQLLWDNCLKTDIDICSSLTPQEVEERLDRRIKIVPVNPRIGTLKFIIGEEEYEYTCFRRDSYPTNGKHTPNEVIFVTDICEDALRRDFTVNALYCEVSKGEVIDPTGNGLADLKNRLIRTTTTPNKVFGEDGLRLLRLARFAAELGFEIEPDTFEAAQKCADRLADIAPERKSAELDKILYADKKYDISNAHYKGLVTIGKLGLWKYLIPEMEDCIGLSQREDYHKYDVYNHILESVRVSPPGIRLTMLLHDIGKPSAITADGNMHRHATIGADMANRILNSTLRYPKAVTARTERLIRNHMYDIDGLTGIGKLRVFIQKNYDIIEDLLEVREADGRATGNNYDDKIVNRMRTCFLEMKRKNIPLTVRDLDINGIDILELGAINIELADLLKGVLTQCAKEGRRMTKEEQLDWALRLLNEK
ncbi:MAG: CCA tRNA nucleotidyltransferase [Clostridia bacterium]|nr:CCA tRNA nucleotidyltransferase [Clostridia bacterium]